MSHDKFVEEMQSKGITLMEKAGGKTFDELMEEKLKKVLEI